VLPDGTKQFALARAAPGCHPPEVPRAQWFVYEPVPLDASASVAGQLCRQSIQPLWQMDQAKAILALDCDFIGAEADTHRAIRDFARGRKIAKPGDAMNRLYVVEGLMTQTGMNADHRLRVPTSAVDCGRRRLGCGAGPGQRGLKALAQSSPCRRAWTPDG